MSHGMKDDIDVTDLLGHMSADELRELADKKERAAQHSGLTDGLRSVAAVIENNPELDWQGNVTFTLWCPYEERGEGRDEKWLAERAEQIGGEWEWESDGTFFNLRQRHGAVTLELTSPKPVLDDDEVALASEREADDDSREVPMAGDTP